MQRRHLSLIFHPHPSSMAALLTPTIPTSNLRSFPPFYFVTPPQPSSPTNHHHHQWQLKQFKKQKLLALCTSYEVGGGYSDEELKSRGKSVRTRQEPELPKWAPSQYEAIIKGGEQVVSVLQEVAKLVSFSTLQLSCCCF